MKDTKALVVLILAVSLAVFFFADDFLLFQSTDSSAIVFPYSRDSQEFNGSILNHFDVEFVDLSTGEGETAVSGSDVIVSYKSWMEKRGELIPNVNEDVPLAFTLGRGEVISGWDEGLVGMKPGGLRRLVVPPRYGYGWAGLANQFGDVMVPSNTALVFEVLLLSVSND